MPIHRRSASHLTLAAILALVLLAAGPEVWPAVQRVLGNGLVAPGQTEKEHQAGAPAQDEPPGLADRLFGREQAAVQLAQDTAVQSSQIKVAGEGFEPGEPLVLEAVLKPGQDTVEVAVLAANEDGRLPETTLPLPEAVTSGERTLRLVGHQSGHEGEATLYVRASQRWLQVQSETLHPTDKVGFVAGGFEPEETVRAAFGRTEAETTFDVSTDRVGNTEWTEFSLPSFEPGEYRLVLTGATSGETVSRAIKVEPLKPVLELSPWYGPPGGQLDVNAQGFLAGETVVVSYDGVEVGQIEADQYGNIWGARAPAIPYEAAQTVEVELRGLTSTATASANYKVAQPEPWLELSTYSGAPGTAVYVSGGGWAAQERVTLHLGEAATQAVGGGVANEQGYLQYAGPASIPPTSEETVVIVAVGEKSGAEARAEFTIVRPYIPGLDELGGPRPRQRSTLTAPTSVPRITPTPPPTPSPR